MKYIIVEGFAHLVKFGIKPLVVNSIFLHLVFQRILSNLRALNANVVLCFANDISLGRFLKILATNCFRKKLVSSERQGNEISWSLVFPLRLSLLWNLRQILIVYFAHTYMHLHPFLRFFLNEFFS